MPQPDELLAEAARAKKEGRPEAARQAILTAIALLRENGSRIELASALRILGELERSRSGSDGGIAAYEESVAILRGENDLAKLAHTLRHLGDIHRHLGNLNAAVTCCEEAFAIYQQHHCGSQLDRANAARSAALAQEIVSGGRDAAARWVVARDLYEAAGVAAGVTESSTHLAALG